MILRKTENAVNGNDYYSPTERSTKASNTYAGRLDDASRIKDFANVQFKVDISPEALEKSKATAKERTRIEKEGKIYGVSDFDIYSYEQNLLHDRKAAKDTDMYANPSGVSEFWTGTNVSVNMSSEYWNKSIEDLSSELLNDYAKGYANIVKGYENGTREVYFKDKSAETGYRKLTMEEELSFLDAAFEKEAERIEGLTKDKLTGVEADIKITQERERLIQKGFYRNRTPISHIDQVPQWEKDAEKLKGTIDKNITQTLIATAKKFVEEFKAKNGTGIDTDNIFKNLFSQKQTTQQ